MQLRFLATMNGTLFIDICFAMVMFGIYVVETYRATGYSTRVQAAVSIMVVLLGEAVLRGWFWLWRLQAGADPGWVGDYPVLPLGMAIQMFGVLLLIRVFSPDVWSRGAWIAVGVTSAAGATLAAILTGR